MAILLDRSTDIMAMDMDVDTTGVEEELAALPVESKELVWKTRTHMQSRMIGIAEMRQGSLSAGRSKLITRPLVPYRHHDRNTGSS